MKKLMIAATVAICATAGFALESANIVGYSTLQISEKKYNPVGVPFASVGADAMKLSGLVPSVWDWEADELRTLTATDGGTSTSMFYVFPEQVEDFGVEGAGWYDGDGNCYNDVESALGTGFLTCLYSDVSFTSAGQVYGDAILLEFKGATESEKYNIVPNAVPRTLALADIVPDAWDWEADELRVLNTADGGTEVSLFYVFPEQVEDFGVEGAGWYDGDGNCYNDYEVKPGEGFLSCLYSDVCFTLPAAM